MKKQLALLIGLLLLFSASSQSCLPDGIIFATQSQIDSFQFNYPNCTEIEGDVTIFGSEFFEITNLNGLSLVTSIGSDLTIYMNEALTNLTGLEGLAFVGGDLTINGNLYMTNLTGLDNLTSIGGSLIIYWNDSLTSLTGLENLTSVGGGLVIEDLPGLTSLMGLNNLTSIGGELMIDHNITLNSLTGLNNIYAGSISNLYIRNNSSLSTCAVQSICEYLANPNGTIEIHDNASGCVSQEEVEDACGVGLEDVGTLESLINIYPNPSSSQFTIEAESPINQGVIDIFSMNGLKLYHCQITEHKADIDISYLPAGVYFVRFSCADEVRMLKVVKY
jgi:hypothetical protein